MNKKSWIWNLVSASGKRKSLNCSKSVIDTQQNTLDTVERAVNNQEQYSRRNCLRFHGVSESEGEDTDALICQIANEKLNVPLTKDDRTVCRQRRRMRINNSPETQE